MPRHSSQFDQAWRSGASHEQFVDPLLDALVLICRYYGETCSRDALVSGLPLVNNSLNPLLFPRAAERAGLSARLVTQGLSQVVDLLLPCVLLLKQRRCCVLLKLDREQEQALVLLPEAGEAEQWLPLEQLESLYSGQLFYLKRRYRFDERSPEVLNTGEQHWFWSSVWRNWSVYRDVLVASLLINLFAVATPLFVMNVYDRIVPNLAFDSLWVLAVGVALVFCFDFVLRQLRAYFIDVAGKKVDLEVSARIYAQVMGMRMEGRPPSVGGFANQLQSFESVREFIMSATVTALIDLPFSLLFLAVIWVVAGPLVVAPMVAMLILLAYSFAIQRILARSIEKTAQLAAQKNATLIESLSGLEAIKSSGAQSKYQRLWEQAVAEMGREETRSRKVANSVSSLSSLLQQLVTVAVVVFGVYQLAAGELSMGGIIAAVMLGSRAVLPMAQLSLLATRFNQARASLTLINRIMDVPQEQPAGTALHLGRLTGDLVFDHVDFRYPQSQSEALTGISFHIRPGEKVAIIGRIGAGKSTLCRLLQGLYQPERGAIRVDGINLAQLHPSDLRRNLGYVSQDSRLFYGSIRENILLGAPFATDADLLRAAEFAGVTSFTHLDPEGMERQVGECGRLLSGGQQQAVALARAVLLDPAVLLFDEPTSNLDNRAEQAFLNRLSTLGKEKTLLLVTHKMTMLDAVERILVLDRGHLVADGPKEQVLKMLSSGQIPAGSRMHTGAAGTAGKGAV